MLINSWKLQEMVIKRIGQIPEAHRGSVAWIIISVLQDLYEEREKKKRAKKA